MLKAFCDRCGELLCDNPNDVHDAKYVHTIWKDGDKQWYVKAEISISHHQQLCHYCADVIFEQSFAQAVSERAAAQVRRDVAKEGKK